MRDVDLEQQLKAYEKDEEKINFLLFQTCNSVPKSDIDTSYKPTKRDESKSDSTAKSCVGKFFICGLTNFL